MRTSIDLPLLRPDSVVQERCVEPQPRWGGAPLRAAQGSRCTPRARVCGRSHTALRYSRDKYEHEPPTSAPPGCRIRFSGAEAEATAAAESARAAAPLARGWREAYSPDGHTFYYDTDRQTTWERHVDEEYLRAMAEVASTAAAGVSSPYVAMDMVMSLGMPQMESPSSLPLQP